MTDLIPFTFESHNVRVVMVEGEPWWIAQDVCQVLGIRNSRDTLSHLDEDEKSVVSNDTKGVTRKYSIINESGLYSLILRSRKKEAKEFKRWLTRDVIPSIRKTGQYRADNLSSTEALLESVKRMVEIEKEQKLHTTQIQHLMDAQAWMTIRQYVVMHELVHQLPPGTVQQAYGRYLAGYCREHGIPIYQQQSDQFREWTYPVFAIQRTLADWVAQQGKQRQIMGLHIQEDGIDYRLEEKQDA